MSQLNQAEANRIITSAELVQLGQIVEINNMAIRCNKGNIFSGGDGFNLSTDQYPSNIDYATALYASICFAQDTIHTKLSDYSLLLLIKCALGSGETYNYQQGRDTYTTLPKCHGLGADTALLRDWSMDDSAIILSRKVVERILLTS
ncbi:MAG: hypothetical protein RL571_1571 [Pseudomonadota bacterium]|jgi:hypothetical protein